MRSLPIEAYLTKEELIREIKKPGAVMVAAKMTDDDVMYVRVIKSDLLFLLGVRGDDGGKNWIAERENGTLYVG